MSKNTSPTRQFTATVYLFNKEGKTLLIFHRKIQKWLPPGGHIDPNELPTEAACREAHEETGLQVELITNETLKVDCWNAKSFTRPYLCLLEEIPAHNDQPSHQHMDLIYLGHPVSGSESLNQTETEDLRWFSLKEVEELPSEKVIFEEVKQVLRHIYADTSLSIASNYNEQNL